MTRELDKNAVSEPGLALINGGNAAVQPPGGALTTRVTSEAVTGSRPDNRVHLGEYLDQLFRLVIHEIVAGIVEHHGRYRVGQESPFLETLLVIICATIQATYHRDNRHAELGQPASQLCGEIRQRQAGVLAASLDNETPLAWIQARDVRT